MVFWIWKLDTLMLFMLLIIRCSEELNRTRLSLLGLLPNSCLFGQKNLTAEVLPAVHLALKHLYKHRWMLKNYELQVSFHDTQVNGCRCRVVQCLSLLCEHTSGCLWLNLFLANPGIKSVWIRGVGKHLQLSRNVWDTQKVIPKSKACQATLFFCAVFCILLFQLSTVTDL